MNIIKIRAHHIESARRLFHLKQKDIAEILIGEKYIEKEEDPFVTLLTQYLNLFNNPLQQFKLKIGGLDLICLGCPELKRKCKPRKDEEPRYNPLLRDLEDLGRDSEIVEEYKLDINKIYTAHELRKIFGF